MKSFKTKSIGLIMMSFVIQACSPQKFSLPADSQSFAQGAAFNNKVDIVLMIDNSSSMLQYQRKFSDQIPAMLAKLNSSGVDYNIVVVTTDVRTGGNGSQFIGTPKVLKPTTSDLNTVLANRVLAGQTGSDLEQGLVSVKNALSPSYLTNQGTGFFRDDAMMALIFLSNEDDYSSGSTQSYIDFLNQLKPPLDSGAPGWVANFLGITSLSSQCNTTSDYKEPGLRYMALADYSGGIKSSICDTALDKAVENVRVRILEYLTDFYLDRLPVPETILVKINGNVVPKSATNGWTYESKGNFIRFHGNAVPVVYDKISVDFSPAEAT
jgi:hypothetical protein